MIHLGSKVSALLDGRLPAAEEERCWAHVAVCPPCRDLVEREGWIKTRLAGLSFDSACASSAFKESLARASSSCAAAPVPAAGPERRMAKGVVAASGSALGVAVLGMLALNAGPPAVRPPAADVSSPVTSPSTPTGDTSRRGPSRASSVASWTPREMVELVVAMSAPAVASTSDATPVVSLRGSGTQWSSE